MVSSPIAIVGAGITGLTAAAHLREAGEDVTVIDKGRGPGGRMATRVTRAGLRFDHGAQVLRVEGAGFQRVLEKATEDGAVAPWQMGDDTALVGQPGMADFAVYLGHGTPVRQSIKVTRLAGAPGAWEITTSEGSETFGAVLLTIPPAQAAMLLDANPIADEAAAVEMVPSLALMAAFSPGPPPPFVARSDGESDLSWIAHDGSKPGRGGAATFVAIASLAWSKAHLEAEKPEIGAGLLPLLADAIGRDPGEATYSGGHRWRYARAHTPLGRPFLADPSGTLFVGGDWCLGPHAEHGWESGRAMAEALLSARS
ncbi:MAG: FAD-dependent oxidoreductase [Pseudomonadota bacterium]